jgi:trigger factor
MNITKENTGNLTAEIKVEISQNDYQDKITKQLKEYQHKANIPGFRVGKVPIGMIQKMYGKPIKIDEINKIISESLDKYIKENNLNLLGSPLMNEIKNSLIDWDTQTDFEFYFDIALQPEINIDLKSMTLESFKIIADDKMIDNIVRDTQKRQGHAHSHDEADENDIIHADAEELDENGTVKENGIKTKASFSVEKISNKDIKASIIGLKKEDIFDINFAEALGSEHDASHALNLGHDSEGLGSTYRIKATEISHLHEAEVNEELFEATYPGQEIKTLEAFRNKIKEEAENYYVRETDQKLLGDVIGKLIAETEVELPADFIKRLLMESNSDKLTNEELDENIDAYIKSMKWQLIENKLIKDNNLVVAESDVRNYIKDVYLGQYFPKAQDEEQDKRLDGIVDTIMKNEKEVKRIYDEMYDKQMIELFKQKVKTNPTEVTFDEFVKLVGHNHDH